MDLTPVLDKLEETAEDEFSVRSLKALKDVLAGKASAVDYRNKCDSWWRKRLVKVILENKQRWEAGTLFAAQTQDFDSWLEYRHAHWDPRDDQEVYEKVSGNYMLCGSEVPAEIRWFWWRRIVEPRSNWKNPKERQEKLDIWSKENRKNGWMWTRG